MKSVNSIRCVDELGRVVLPFALRAQLGISAHDSFEIFVDDNDRIILERVPSPAREETVIGAGSETTCVRFLEGVWPVLCE